MTKAVNALTRAARRKRLTLPMGRVTPYLVSCAARTPRVELACSSLSSIDTSLFKHSNKVLCDLRGFDEDTELPEGSKIGWVGR